VCTTRSCFSVKSVLHITRATLSLIYKKFSLYIYIPTTSHPHKTFAFLIIFLLLKQRVLQNDMRSHNCAELVSSRSIQEEKKLPVSGRDVKFSSYCLAAFLSDGTDGCGLALTRMPTEASAHRRACTRTFTHPPPRRRGWWWRSMGYKRRCCRPRPPPRSTRADALLVTRSPRLPAA
jgi:hypothetical protein